MMTGNMFVVTAPSGAGKTTLVSGLLAADSKIQLSISHTTRPPRAGEIDGKHYHFIDRQMFESMINAGDFLESAEVYGNYYGTSHAWIREQIASGQDILLEIDWQGAEQVRRIFPSAIGIFILPPSLDTLETRLRARGKDDEATIAKRMQSAQLEISFVDNFDYIIVNEDMKTAIFDLTSIVRSQRLKQIQQSARHTRLISELKGSPL